MTEMSPTVGKLFTALAKAQADIKGAAKDSVNPHFKSQYADLASVWEACRGPLTKHELSILQPVDADGAAVKVTTILAHSSGEWVKDTLTIRAQQETPQAVGSAITYGRRYGLAAMVGIAPEDDDGEAAQARSVVTPLPAEKPSGKNTYAPKPVGEDWPACPQGAVYIARVTPGDGKVVAEVTTHLGESYPLFKDPLKALAEEVCQLREAVVLDLKTSGVSGKAYVAGIRRVSRVADADQHTAPLHASDIPF